MKYFLPLLLLQGLIGAMSTTTASKTLRIKPSPSPPAQEPQQQGISTGYQVDILTVDDENASTETIDNDNFSFTDITTIELIPHRNINITTHEDVSEGENIVYFFDREDRTSKEQYFHGKARNFAFIGECNILHQGSGRLYGSLNADMFTFNLSMRPSSDGGSTYWLLATNMNDLPED